MKKFIPVMFLLAACHGNANFSKIKVGMHGKDVVALVGEPGKKNPVFGDIEWWTYNSDNKLLVMSGDTVQRVVLDMKATQDSIDKVMGEAQGKMDSLKKEMDNDAKK